MKDRKYIISHMKNRGEMKVVIIEYVELGSFSYFVWSHIKGGIRVGTWHRTSRPTLIKNKVPSFVLDKLELKNWFYRERIGHKKFMLTLSTVGCNVK